MVPLIAKLKKFAKRRARDWTALATADLTPDAAESGLTGPKVSFKIDVERRAAWKLYVELNTRIATQPLRPSEGLLREALSSLYAIFGITRDILKEAGPGVARGQESLGFYAM